MWQTNCSLVCKMNWSNSWEAFPRFKSIKENIFVCFRGEWLDIMRGNWNIFGWNDSLRVIRQPNKAAEMEHGDLTVKSPLNSECSWFIFHTNSEEYQSVLQLLKPVRHANNLRQGECEDREKKKKGSVRKEEWNEWKTWVYKRLQEAGELVVSLLMSSSFKRSKEFLEPQREREKGKRGIEREDPCCNQEDWYNRVTGWKNT